MYSMQLILHGSFELVLQCALLSLISVRTILEGGKKTKIHY